MPTEPIESRLKFVFNDDWKVFQYDRHLDYRAKIIKLTPTKAVDFVAVYEPKKLLYFIEVKNFRKSRVQNKSRMANGELGHEIATKVRDTIAGVVAAYHRGNTDDWGAAFTRLATQEPSVRVLLWLEDDLFSKGPQGRRFDALTSINKELKKQLQWLTSSVFVKSLAVNGRLDGLEVSYLSDDLSDNF